MGPILVNCSVWPPNRVTHRLDQAEYAVKKVYAKLSQETALVKILREVTLLAKVGIVSSEESVRQVVPGDGPYQDPPGGHPARQGIINF